MRGTCQNLDLWLDPTHSRPPIAFLDVTDWQILLDWISIDKAKRVPPLSNGEWCIHLPKRLLERQFGVDSRRTKCLINVGIKLEETAYRQDETFILEVIRTYFNNDPSARPQAELLTYARRAAGNGLITIISQHRGFWRIPLVNTYFINPTSLRGQEDLPAYFDFLLDLGIHRQLAAVVAPYLAISSPSQIIEMSLTALRDHVQNVSGLTIDGRPLMEQAFQQDGAHCRLNPLTNLDLKSSQQNEQRGFREFYTGVVTGLRNPLVHEGMTSTFAQSRYPDKRTLLKYLSFLSILFERADRPLP